MVSPKSCWCHRRTPPDADQNTGAPAKSIQPSAGAKSKRGALGRVRTCNLRIRSPVLYPVELRAPEASCRPRRSSIRFALLPFRYSNASTSSIATCIRLPVARMNNAWSPSPDVEKLACWYKVVETYNDEPVSGADLIDVRRASAPYSTGCSAMVSGSSWLRRDPASPET